METLFGELKRYVGWAPQHERTLQALRPRAAAHFQRIVDAFYDRILEHEDARQVLSSGESLVGHLKVKLVAWMDRLLTGPWDEEYYELRCRIGRVHVRIGLPQHYMFGAMNVLRDQLNFVIHEVYPDDDAAVRDARTAASKILDLELAIMLHTYREDLEAQNARSERLATFGQLIGSIGHELRNPLGVMESSIYILEQRAGGDAKIGKHTTRLREQVQIANGIVSALLDMIRDKPLLREAVQVAVTIASVVSSLRIPPAVRLHTSGLEDLPAIVGDPVQVRQMFLNLIENALQAIDGDGEVHISGSFDGRRVEIAVEDSGPGVDAETRRRLFEPLITTKASGIGLGLALVKRIAERHGGDVRYVPRGRGARFVVSLQAGVANA